MRQTHCNSNSNKNIHINGNHIGGAIDPKHEAIAKAGVQTSWVQAN